MAKNTTWRYGKNLLTMLGLLALIFFAWTAGLSAHMHEMYHEEISVQILDRNGQSLQLLPNKKGAYMIAATGTERVRALAVKTEDKYFYYHLGINPVSAVRSFVYYVFFKEHVGGSTITQQLSKGLLGNENERTIRNKLVEVVYAVALELHTSKEEILTMYLNSAYFGNQVEGVEGAARQYFGKNAGELTDGEIVELLALLSAPSFSPGTAGNLLRARHLGERIGVAEIPEYHAVPSGLREPKKDTAMFELGGLVDCTQTCTLSVDRDLTERIREIVRANLASPKFNSVSNASVAVIRVGKGDEPNALLALIGSPNPYGNSSGSQINMALLPRPIGSTWKPFIYGEAITRGARPYTLIDDNEYRYEIGTGYAFYPKNYDGIYRGPVTLHYALSNSLNVPAVRALQFDDVDDFGTFMREQLGFVPLQSFDTYQLSVALGGLEMNPLLLAHYFSVFPRGGILAPLELTQGSSVAIPMSLMLPEQRRIFAGTTTQLINRMLSDRLMGVEQFGLESNLNLPFADYAVKTGTTYDYHDSWTVGYTSDVVVVVWIGNSNNKAMDLLSGARGAGKIWHDVMALLFAEGETIPQPFDKSALIDISTEEGNSFGLVEDDVLVSRSIMRSDALVLEPHHGDVLLYQEGMSVPLRSKSVLTWSVDGRVLGVGKEVFWMPTDIGVYRIIGTDPKTGKVIVMQIHVTKL